MVNALKKFISYYCIFIGLYAFFIKCCCTISAQSYNLYQQIFSNAMNDGFVFVAIFTFGVVLREKLMDNDKNIENVENKNTATN